VLEPEVKTAMYVKKADFSGYNQFIIDKWHSFAMDGCGGYVLKEKHNLIRDILKILHQAHSQNLD